MPDQFANHSGGLESPARRATPVTPSDSVDLADTARGLYIGAGGDVALIAAGDTVAVTFAGLVAGTILPVRTKRVMVTGTDATSIVALW